MIEDSKQLIEEQKSDNNKQIVTLDKDQIEQLTKQISEILKEDIKKQFNEFKKIRSQKNKCGSLFIFIQFIVLIVFVLFVVMLKEDIVLRKEQQKIEAAHKVTECSNQYELNKCSRNLPAQRQYCSELELCMRKQVDSEVQGSVALSHIIGDMINVFFSDLNDRSLWYFMITMGVLVLSGFCFGC